MRKLAKLIILLVNIAVSVLYVGALLAPVVPCDRFVVFAHVGLIFPILAAIEIGFVIFWIFARKWWFLLPLALLVVSAKPLNRTFCVYKPKVETESERKLKILSYNISYFNSGIENLLDYIEASDADIVCLQEFIDDKRGTAAIRRLKKKYPYYHTWKHEKTKKWWGTVTFSRYPIVGRQTIEYPSRNNGSICTDIKIDGQIVRVFNNHFESNKLKREDWNNSERLADKLGSADKLRTKQARAVAERIAKTPYPTIVCGDFNDVPQSYTYHTLCRGLTDAVSSSSYGYNCTFAQKLLFVRIDHILVSKEFVPLGARIDHVPYSDHYPVLSTVVFDEF